MDIERHIDRDVVRWPPDDDPEFAEVDDDTLYWEGRSLSRDWADLRGAGREDLDLILEAETRWLAAHPEGHGDDAAEDELFEYVSETLGHGFAMLDPGTASVVVALSALGCVTTVSCKGGAGHQYQHPLVAFWCPPSVIDPILAAAEVSSCGIANSDSDGCLLLYACELKRFPEFAQAVLDRL